MNGAVGMRVFFPDPQWETKKLWDPESSTALSRYVSIDMDSYHDAAGWQKDVPFQLSGYL